jgi:hypothetical protein
MVSVVTPAQANPHSRPWASEAPLFQGVDLSLESRSRNIWFWNSCLDNIVIESLLTKYEAGILS